MIGLEWYTPTQEQVETMGRIIFSYKHNKLYSKKDGDNILAYHPRCGRQGIISKKIYKQARYTHLCPFCCKEIDSTTNKDSQVTEYFVSLKVGDEVYGYYVYNDFQLGKGTYTDCDQVYYASGNDCYHRYLGFDLFANNLSLQPCKEDWKYSKRSSWSSYYYATVSRYENAMCDYHYCKDRYLVETTKKDYLENYAGFIVKSNQKKIAVDNLLNTTQMKFIKTFDLKGMDEIEKYKSYMKNNRIHIDDFMNDDLVLNPYYLDYLYRNKIDLGTYYTYLHNLKQLGFKYDKPKDWKFRFEKIDEMVSAEKDKDINKKIKIRYNKLPKYEDGNITISPFSSAWEIRHCGKELHNCIGGFVTKYADKITDIYHLDIDGATKVALEIKNLKLAQAHADNNSSCPKDLMKHIKLFCETNGFSLGNYA